MQYLKAIASVAVFIFTKPSTAAVIAAGAAATSAGAAGVEPLGYVIGAMAATVVYAYRKPSTREKALANGLICIFMGGVVAPWSGGLIEFYFGSRWVNDLVLAGVLSAAWPWLMPVVWERFQSKVGADKPASEKGVTKND
jgi:hypothetical protein